MGVHKSLRFLPRFLSRFLSPFLPPSSATVAAGAAIAGCMCSLRGIPLLARGPRRGRRDSWPTLSAICRGVDGTKWPPVAFRYLEVMYENCR
jgi:hypothetical protein